VSIAQHFLERRNAIILTDQQRQEFETAARPLIEWMNKNCPAHVTAIVELASAELLQGVCSVRVKDYLRD